MTSQTAILVAYATKKGSTREVAEAIAATLAEQGHGVDVRAADEVRTLDAYSGVVLGGALYTGRWHGDARDFLKRHCDALESMALAVYAMGPKTLDKADVAGSRAQLDAALAKTPNVTPTLVVVFGGVFDPRSLRFPFNRLSASDARDWDAIRQFAEQAGSLFAHNAQVVRI
jgi:menaquinone-dependent protoporphyrinogen oxidase